MSEPFPKASNVRAVTPPSRELPPYDRAWINTTEMYLAPFHELGEDGVLCCACIVERLSFTSGPMVSRRWRVWSVTVSIMSPRSPLELTGEAQAR